MEESWIARRAKTAGSLVPRALKFARHPEYGNGNHESRLDFGGATGNVTMEKSKVKPFEAVCHFAEQKPALPATRAFRCWFA
jgi:hypothetical protein